MHESSKNKNNSLFYDKLDSTSTLNQRENYAFSMVQKAPLSVEAKLKHALFDQPAFLAYT
jgi:hypothetical protein